MWLYYFIVFYILLISIAVYKRALFYQDRSRNRDSIFFFFTMGFLLLLNCLRSLYTGNDTLSYYKLFKYYSSGVTFEEYSTAGYYWIESYVDIGWRILNKVFSKFSESYQLFISFVAVFLYFFTIKYIKKFSSNIVISVLLFYLMFYHQYLNVLRQAVAIVIILMAQSVLIKKKYIKYCIYVIISATFHKFALIVLVFIIFSIMKIDRKIERFAILIAAIFSLTGGVNALVVRLGYSGGYLTDQTGISTIFSFLLNGIIFCIMDLIVSKGIKEEHIYDDNVNFNINFYRWINLTVFCLSILEMSMPAIYRVEYFFTVYQIVSIPYIISYSKMNNKTKKSLLYIIIIILIIYQTGIFIYRPEWITDFPYYFFWQVHYL